MQILCTCLSSEACIDRVFDDFSLVDHSVKSSCTSLRALLISASCSSMEFSSVVELYPGLASDSKSTTERVMWIVGLVKYANPSQIYFQSQHTEIAFVFNFMLTLATISKLD